MIEILNRIVDSSKRLEIKNGNLVLNEKSEGHVVSIMNVPEGSVAYKFQATKESVVDYVDSSSGFNKSCDAVVISPLDRGRCTILLIEMKCCKQLKGHDHIQQLKSSIAICKHLLWASNLSGAAFDINNAKKSCVVFQKIRSGKMTGRNPLEDGQLAYIGTMKVRRSYSTVVDYSALLGA